MFRGTSNTREKYPITRIVRNLKSEELRFFKPKLIPISRDSYKFSFGGEEKEINTTRTGTIYEDEIDKIAEVVSEKTGKNRQNAYNFITRNPTPLGLEKKATDVTLVLLSVALATLILSQTKLLTGYAISNIYNTTSTTGIFICVVGIIGLLVYKRRCRNK